MNFKTKYLLILFFGIWLTAFSLIEQTLWLKVIFLIVGILDMIVSTCAITVYNYDKGFYRDLND
ncbi:MAG: hypothetical protein IJ287_03195 [Methanobrevibacter sp.]|nr:hypothetical protein [Methanobrevibacter sp.]